MPFITEELYQRLPRKKLIYPSICVSPYPDGTEVGYKNYIFITMITIKQDWVVSG